MRFVSGEGVCPRGQQRLSRRHSGAQCITCSYKASSGLLYPLERGFIYVHKPPVHIRFDEISFVNFARGTTTTRSFDFEIETKQGTQYTFSSIERWVWALGTQPGCAPRRSLAPSARLCPLPQGGVREALRLRQRQEVEHQEPGAEGGISHTGLGSCQRCLLPESGCFSLLFSPLFSLLALVEEKGPCDILSSFSSSWCRFPVHGCGGL